MSLPIGIDIGNQSSVYAVLNGNSVDIILNESSNRSTPTVVSFGEKSRYIGEEGKLKQSSNTTNTALSLKRLVGLEWKDVELERRYQNVELVQLEQDTGISVDYLEQKTEFSTIQLMSMFFHKSKSIIEAENNCQNLRNVVLTVPAWYDEKQRYRIKDSARIAGLHPILITNETTAAAVYYGISKTDLPVHDGRNKPKIVVFIDIGDSTFTCSITCFYKDHLKVLGIGYDKYLGGRDYNLAVANHFIAECDKKHGTNLKSNPKAINRMLLQSEKIKKVLSVNTSSSFNIESLINDIDFSSELSRESFEKIIEPLNSRISQPIMEALSQANISPSQIDAVEIIGGTTRIPSIRAKISELLNVQLTSTINQDEAVAKGAAFLCGLCSSNFRTRPFKFVDINQHSVLCSWKCDGEHKVNENNCLEIFRPLCSAPSTKFITVNVGSDFTIFFDLNAPTKNSSTIKPTHRTVWRIEGISPANKTVPVELRILADISGLYYVREAYSMKEISEKDAMKCANDIRSKNKETPHLVKDKKLKVKSSTYSLPHATIDEFVKQEESMAKQDKLIKDTHDLKNAFEEQIYQIRARLDNEYIPYYNVKQKQQFLEILAEQEDWLYGDGEDATKEEYSNRKLQLDRFIQPIKQQYDIDELEKQKAIKAQTNMTHNKKNRKSTSSNKRDSSENIDRSFLNKLWGKSKQK